MKKKSGRTKRVRWAAFSKPLLGLLLGTMVIVAWQAIFVPKSVTLTKKYRDRITSGLYHDTYRRFFYFYHHLGLFPVAATTEPSVDTHAGAQAFVETHGSELVNEINWAIRSGERGKILLFLPDAWMRGSALSASVRPFNILFFISSLVALWVAFCWIGQPLVGAFAIAFLGSNPFQLAEVYKTSNIFGIPGSAAIWLMALFLPTAFGGTSPRYRIAIVAFTILMVGTLGVIRPEPTTLLLSPLLVVALCWPLTIPKKSLVCLAIVLGVFSTSRLWNAYFDSKTQAAVALVDKSGGYPYPAFFYAHHRFWHPLCIGLGDYDRKYGARNDDHWTYSLAGKHFPQDQYPYHDNNEYLDRYHDAKQHYGVKWEDLPEYNEFLRLFFLDLISRDPFWYLNILANRVLRILSDSTPLSVQVGSWGVHLPWPGWIWLGVLFAALRRRRVQDFVMLLFFVPISITSLVIYAGEGRSYYSIFHLMAAVVLVSWAWEWVRRKEFQLNWMQRLSHRRPKALRASSMHR